MRGEAQMSCFFFLAKLRFLSEIHTLSHKLLVRQTSSHHHCNWHAQRPTCKDFQLILSSSSWPKTTVYFLRNKYSYQIGNAMGKIMKCYKQAPSLPQESKYISLKQIGWVVFKIWHYDSIIGIFLNFILSKVK